MKAKDLIHQHQIDWEELHRGIPVKPEPCIEWLSHGSIKKTRKAVDGLKETIRVTLDRFKDRLIVRFDTAGTIGDCTVVNMQGVEIDDERVLTEIELDLLRHYADSARSL